MRIVGVMGTTMVAGVLLTCLAGQAQLSVGAPTYYRDVLPILSGGRDLSFVCDCRVWSGRFLTVLVHSRQLRSNGIRLIGFQ